MNKKGFIFTFISVVLISVILLAFLIQYTSRTRNDIEIRSTQVETMNSFVKLLNEDYFPRAIEISGNQAILSLLHCMDPSVDCGDEIENRLSNGYINENDELSHYIINAIVDGKFKEGWGEEGELLELMRVDKVSYKLNDTLDEVKKLANSTGIILEYEDIRDQSIKQRMEVYQDNPFYVNVSITLSYSIKNKEGDISWDYASKKIKSSIPIVNFREPIYMIEYEGGTNIIITKSTYELPGEIESHAANTMFIGCTQAPGFLKRLQRILDADLAGIESLIESKRYSGQTAIGYQVINGYSPMQLTNIDGYSIDKAHEGCYGVGDFGDEQFNP